MPRSLFAAVACAAAVLAACSSTVGGHGAASSADQTATSLPAATTAVGGPFGTSTSSSGGSVATGTSATSTPTIPVTATPSAPATVVSNAPGIFVGTWTGHARTLVVDADGSARVDYRLYRTCGTDAPPCDRIVGDSIIDGGHVTLQTQRVVTANHTSTLTATVLTSTDPTYRVGTTQTFTLRGDIIDSPYATFCDAKSDGQCGA
jgi:hypothetical protein